AVEFAQKQKDERQFGQSSLFDDSGEKEYSDFVFEDFPEQSKSEKLKQEKQLIGFYFSGHPLDEYRTLWEKAVKVDLGKPETLQTGNCILVGIIKTIKTVAAKSGKMAYATLADYNGEIEAVFFPKVWERCQDRFGPEDVAIFRGKLDFQKGRDKHSFIVDGIVNFMEAEDAIAEEAAVAKKREKFRSAWLYMADLKSSMLSGAAKGSYTIIGELTSMREMQDRNGNDMAFATVRDFEGDIDVLFFSKAWNENRDLITKGEFVALKGNIDPSSDRNPQKPGFKVSSVRDLTGLCKTAASKAASGEEPKTPTAMPNAENTFSEKPEAGTGSPPSAVHIRLDESAADSDENISPLRNYLAGNPGPCPVYIHVHVSGKDEIIRTAGGLSLEAEKEALGVLESCVVVAKAWKE
ncbi:MAG: OB-fold nucleic acid binding domain-containing protein, partial [Treponema sp.]|nr:OB-fold nucleic acid binding domain-containing protein [Treponema sp.]